VRPLRPATPLRQQEHDAVLAGLNSGRAHVIGEPEGSAIGTSHRELPHRDSACWLAPVRWTVWFDFPQH
jgi:hypothetical protein